MALPLIVQWLRKHGITQAPAPKLTKETCVDPNRYPVFPGTTAEESECDDNLDEIADIEGDEP